MLGIITALALAAAVDPSAGASSSPPAPTVAAVSAVPATEPGKKAPSPDDKVCWNENPTGSHLPRRVCATRAERDQMQREAEQAMEHHNRSGGGGGLSPH
jgi:hypothetical protein